MDLKLDTMSEDKLANLCQDFLNSSDDELDLLRSESSFLPVYSPRKEPLSRSFENGEYQTDFDQSSMWDTRSESKVEDFPIMTEEEANKLIHLAATIVQAHVRGFLIRRKFDFKKFKQKHNAASKIQALWKGYHFRHRSLQGLNIKCELQVQRLQKYVATTFILMEKAEEHHQLEKLQLLEVVQLLYDKVTYLESLAVNTKSESEITPTQEQVHPTFLPHPRLFEENGCKESTSDGNVSTGRTQVVASSSDVSEKKDEVEMNADIKMSLNKDIEEVEFAEDDDLTYENAEGYFEDKEGHVGIVMDKDRLVEEVHVRLGGVVEKRFEKVEKRFEKVEGNDKESCEDKDSKFGDKMHERFKGDSLDNIHKKCYAQQLEEDKHHGNDGNQDFTQTIDGEYEGEENESGEIGDPVMNPHNRDLEISDDDDDAGVLAIKLENLFETEGLMSEVESKAMIDHEIKGGAKEPEDLDDNWNSDTKEPEDPGGHLNNPVDRIECGPEDPDGPLNDSLDSHEGGTEEPKDSVDPKDSEDHLNYHPDNKDVEIEDFDVGPGQEKHVETMLRPTVGDTEDNTGESMTVHDVQDSSLDPTKSPEKTSSGITQNIEVHVEKLNNSDLKEETSLKEDEQLLHKDMEGLQGENAEPETKTPETTRISPRLGKRASSLLSALKDEISNLRPNSADDEQSTSGQVSTSQTQESPEKDVANQSLSHVSSGGPGDTPRNTSSNLNEHIVDREEIKKAKTQ